MKKVWIINPAKKRRRVKRVKAGRKGPRKSAYRGGVRVKPTKRMKQRGYYKRAAFTPSGKKVFEVVGYNPSRKRRPMARRNKARSAAQKAAFQKMLAARASAGSHRSTTRRTTHRRITVAKRRKKARKGGTIRSVRRVGGAAVARTSWRSSGFRRNPRKRRGHRRSFRRNPSFSIGGIVSKFKQGVTDAAMILGGKGGTRLVANLIPVPSLKDTAIKATALQLAVAIGLGVVANRFLGADKARFVVAGGIVAAAETYINWPGGPLAGGKVAELLGDDTLSLGDGDGGYAANLNAYEGNGLNAYELAALRGPGA